MPLENINLPVFPFVGNPEQLVALSYDYRIYSYIPISNLIPFYLLVSLLIARFLFVTKLFISRSIASFHDLLSSPLKASS